MPAVRRQPDEHDDTLTTTDPSPRSKLAPAVLIEGVAVIVNRRVRQQPGYWFAVLGAGLVLRSTYTAPLQADGRSLASDPLTLAANLMLLQNYHPSTLLSGVGPAWTLAIEVVFYLVLPLLAAAASLLATSTGLGRRKPWLAALAPAGLLLLVGQSGWRLAAALPADGGGSWSGSWHAVVARSFLAHAGLFAAGLTLAVLEVQVRRRAFCLPRRWRTGANCAAGIVSALAVLTADRLGENRFSLALSFASLCLVALVVLDSGGSWSRRILSSRLLTGAGLVSYGVFLWNEPVVWFARQQGWTRTGADGFLLALLLTAALSGALAATSWLAVERPAMSLKRRGPSRREIAVRTAVGEPR